MYEVDTGALESMVRQALDELPPQFRASRDNLVVSVESRAWERDRSGHRDVLLGNASGNWEPTERMSIHHSRMGIPARMTFLSPARGLEVPRKCLAPTPNMAGASRSTT